MATHKQTVMQQGCVVFAKNKERVSAFYQRTLGLAILESEPSYDLLVGHSCEVVVHSIPRQYAAAIKIPQPVVPREDTPIKPTFVVCSLAEVRAAAKATGGDLKPEEQAWRVRGSVVLDGWDPEGNVVQFKQPE